MLIQLTPIVATVGTHITSGSLLLALPIALLAGIVSFISPCVLPLVPGYLSYVTGMSAAELQATPITAGGAAPASPRLRTMVRGRVMAGGLLFILGFSIVFVGLGAAFGGLGAALQDHQDGLTKVFGVVTIVMGLLFAGGLRWLGRVSTFELRSHAAPTVGLIGAPLLGMMFGFGWTPCIGPTLSAVLGLTYSTHGATAARGATLAFAYCLGLGIPFLIVGLAFQRSMAALRVVKRHYPLVMGLGGGLLVAIGVLEVTGAWAQIVTQIQTHFPGGSTLL